MSEKNSCDCELREGHCDGFYALRMALQGLIELVEPTLFPKGSCAPDHDCWEQKMHAAIDKAKELLPCGETEVRDVSW